MQGAGPRVQGSPALERGVDYAGCGPCGTETVRGVGPCGTGMLLGPWGRGSESDPRRGLAEPHWGGPPPADLATGPGGAAVVEEGSSCSAGGGTDGRWTSRLHGFSTDPCLSPLPEP